MLDRPGHTHSWAPLFESLPTGVMLADAEGRYLEANAAACRILGYDRETLLTSRLPEPRSKLLTADGAPMSPDDTPGAIALRTGQAVPKQVLGVVRDDGDVLWLGLSAEPMPGGGVLVTFDDVTRQHLTETILASRARLSELAPSVSLEALLRATLDEAERLTGSCIGFFHFMEEDQQTLTLQAWSTRTENEFCNAVGKGLHYPVSEAGVWVEAVHTRRPVIHNDYGSLPHKRGMPEGHATVLRELVVPVLRGECIVALLGVGNKPFPYGKRDLQTVQTMADLAWDIAERKRSEEALKESEARWITMVEQAGDGFELLDEEGRYVQVNQATCRALGYTREELLGMTVMEVDPNFTAESFGAQFHALIDQPAITFETVHRRKDGTTFPVEVTVSMTLLGGQPRALTNVRDITERKRAEELIRSTSDQLSLVLDSLDAHVAVLDGGGNIVAVNQPWRKFAQENGITHPVGTVEQVNYLGVLASSILDPSGDFTAIRDGIQGVMNGTRPTFTAEYPCNSPTEQRWFRMHVLPLRSGGKGAVVTHENITEEKLAEEALKVSELRLRQAMGVAGLGIWEWDPRTDRTEWFGEMFKIYGIHPEDFTGVGSDYIGFTRADYREAQLQNMQAAWSQAVREAAFNSGEVGSIGDLRELCIVRPDGTEAYTLGSAICVVDEAGQPLRMLGITLDITARKRTEALLQDSEAQLRAIVENSTDAIGVSKEGIHVRVNPAYLAMFGFDPEEDLAGKPILDLIAPASRAQVAQMVKDRAMGLQVPASYEIQGMRKDQSTFDMSVHGSSYEQNGELFTLVILRDVTARRQAERTLEASQRFLAETERIGHVGGWEFDMDTQEQTWTEEVYRIHELDPEFKPTVASGVAFYDEASRPFIEDAVRRAIEHGEGFDLELGIVTAKGHPRHVHAIGKVDLARRKVFGFIQDITERKAIEAALVQSQLQMREALHFNERLLATMPIGASAYRADSGRCILANEALARYLGGSQEDLLKQNFREIASWKATGILDVAERVIATGLQERVEFRLQSSFGKDAWLACEFSTFDSPTGKNLLTLTVDISERKKSDIALLQSERQYRGLFDSMMEGFALHELLLDEMGLAFDYRFLDVNPAFVAMTGLPRDQWVGRTVREILPGIEPRWIREYGQVAETGNPITFEDESKDLGRWYRVTAYRTAPRQFAVLVTDITEQKRSDIERAQLEQQISRSQKMESLGSLAGGVAHDMNNVLGAIMGLASIHQEQEPEGSRLRKSMDTILKACTRGRTLVKGLLGFARQELAEICILDLNQVLREEVALLERTVPASVQVELDLCPDLRPVLGDAASLSHALMNICVNSMDAMPEGGILKLRTFNQEPDSVCLEVVDSGFGMAPEVLEKALDPFFTTKGQGKGTGLGLAIVYGAVKAHHGRLEISSAPDAGTCVRICLPACLPEAMASSSDVSSPKNGRSLDILVVDDDELVQESLSELLRSLGHNPTLAGNGEDALDQLARGLLVDAVLLDLNMPGLGGAGTLHLLRALYPDLPVLIATGRANQAAMDLATRTPLTSLLAKPFSGVELSSHLRQLGLG